MKKTISVNIPRIFLHISCSIAGVAHSGNQVVRNGAIFRNIFPVLAAEAIVGMQATDLSKAIDNLSHEVEVCVTMPKFKIEYSLDEVKESLKELGVNKIFEPTVGDFGNMFSKV